MTAKVFIISIFFVFILVSNSFSQTAQEWYNKGNSLNELGRYEEAIKAYNNAIQINPDYGLAWYNKGVALNELGRYEEAINAYDNAISQWNNGVALDSYNNYNNWYKQMVDYTDKMNSILNDIEQENESRVGASPGHPRGTGGMATLRIRPLPPPKYEQQINPMTYQTLVFPSMSGGGGNNAVADKHGQNAFASGRFVSNGDAQTSLFVARRQTNNATPLILYLDGVSATKSMTLNDQDAWTFRALVVGKSDDGTIYGFYTITGAIQRIGGAVTIYGVTTNTIAESSGSLNATAVVSGTALAIQVTGDAANTMRWVARVEVVQLNY